MDLGLVVIGVLAAFGAWTASVSTDNLAECVEAVYPVDVNKALAKCTDPLYPGLSWEGAATAQGQEVAS